MAVLLKQGRPCAVIAHKPTKSGKQADVIQESGPQFLDDLALDVDRAAQGVAQPPKPSPDIPRRSRRRLRGHMLFQPGKVHRGSHQHPAEPSCSSRASTAFSRSATVWMWEIKPGSDGGSFRCISSMVAVSPADFATWPRASERPNSCARPCSRRARGSNRISICSASVSSLKQRVPSTGNHHPVRRPDATITRDWLAA